MPLWAEKLGRHFWFRHSLTVSPSQSRYRSTALLCTTPQSPAATAPASRGALGMAQSLSFLPRPPLLGNNDDRRQWRKQGGVVGAAASRTQVQNLARSGRWEPQPVRWHCAAMTERAPIPVKLH